MLSIDDWFVAGIALGLAGALVLAFGGLVSIATIRANRGTSMEQLDKGSASKLVDGRADAEAGLILLAVGFVLQAIGYLCELNGDEVRTGGNRVSVAEGMGVVVIVLALLFWWAYQRWRIPRLNRRTEHDSGGAGTDGADEGERSESFGRARQSRRTIVVFVISASVIGLAILLRANAEGSKSLAATVALASAILLFFAFLSEDDPRFDALQDWIKPIAVGAGFPFAVITSGVEIPAAGRWAIAVELALLLAICLWILFYKRKNARDV